MLAFGLDASLFSRPGHPGYIDCMHPVAPPDILGSLGFALRMASPARSPTDPAVDKSRVVSGCRHVLRGLIGGEG